MTITFAFAGWMIPVALTLIAFVYMAYLTKQAYNANDTFGLQPLIAGIICAPILLFLLVVWVVYAAVK